MTSANKIAGKPSRWPKRPPLFAMRLDPDLMIKVKHLALDKRTTMTKFVEDLVKAELRRLGKA